MNKKHFKEKLKALDGVTPIPKVKDDPECILQSRDLLDQLFKTMLAYKQDYGIKWMLGLKEYLDDKKMIPGKFSTRHFDRGHIVEVEFFGHFNHELSFNHPTVVLYDSNSDWILAAPVSTPKHGSSNELHIDVDENDGFKHPCGVCLDNLRVIDKRRILFQYENHVGQKCKVRSKKLDEIDMSILKHYLPFQFEKINAIEESLKKEQEEHEKTKEELNQLKEKIQAEVEVAVAYASKFASETEA